MRLTGGAPVTLHDFDPLHVGCNGAAWSSAGTIYLGLWLGADYGVLYTVPAAGGAAEVLIARDGPDGQPVERQQPQLLPGENALLFTFHEGNRTWQAEHAEVRALDLTTGEEHTLLRKAAAGRYLHSGHLVAATGIDRTALTPFDAAPLAVTGPTVALPRMIAVYDGGVIAQFTATADGMAVFRPAADAARTDELIWIGLDGSETSVVAGEGLEAAMPSPGGRHIAVIAGSAAGAGGLQIYDLERRAFTSLTSGDELELSPVWSPDGGFVYFLRYSDRTEPGLYRIAVDGSGGAERIVEARTVWFNPTSASPDGRFIAGNIWDPDTEQDWDLWFTPSDGSGPLAGFLSEPTNEAWPRFSPDGNWLAFASDRTGTFEVYVKRFPESGALLQVSAGGGRFPIWTPDGKGLLYGTLDNASLLRVDLDLSGTPRISRPRKILDLAPELRVDNYRRFAELDPSGDRVLMVRPAHEWTDRLAVIEDWFPEVRNLAPPGGG